MDARIAVITGTVFAGVLVAGALAAPRSENGPALETGNVVANDGPPMASGPLTQSSRDGDDDREEHDHDDDDEGEEDDD